TQADITVVFQPEALSLNYLRNQEITTIPGERELPITNDSITFGWQE
ncbi:5133_t:CDS:1, partial [Diversispora eburnea]